VSPPPQRRRLWFLLPDAEGSAVLTDASNRLPHVSVELDDGETTAMGTARVVLDRWGLRLPVVELLFDVGAGADGDEVDALVELAPAPAGWAPSDGTAWTPVTGAQPETTHGLAPRVEVLLAERRGERVAEPRRSRWSRPGWHDRAGAWIDRTLVDAGWGPATSVVQVRHWGISAVMRVAAGDRTAWFKAVFPGFHQEPAVTAHLHRTAPGVVAPVLGTDEAEGWLLLEDVGSRFASADLSPETSASAIGRLVAVQRAHIGRTEALLSAGCAHRPLRDVAPALDAVLRNPDLRTWIAVEPDRASALVQWVHDAARAVDELGTPDTLVHGDFHPGNVALTDEGPVLIDWSDAAVTHPLVDVLTWAEWSRDDPELTESVWAAFLAAWDGAVDVERFRPLRTRFMGVAAAYHTVSYAGIVTGVEPSHAYEHADGLTGFFGLLEEAARLTGDR